METPSEYAQAIRIEGKKALYASYMPFLRNGGIFIANRLEQVLGDKVEYMLTYVDDDGSEVSMEINGTVIWKTPRGAQEGRIPGIGIHFTPVEGKDEFYTKRQLEACLGNQLKSSEQSYTF